MFIMVALRNVFRNSRRSAMTLLVIAFGAVALILFGGYKAVTFRNLRESTIRGRLGHLQIFRAGFAKAESPKPLEFGLENAAEIRQAIERDPRVMMTTTQLTLMGLVSNGDKSETFMATGVEPSKTRAMRGQTLVAGKDLPDGEMDAVLLGRGLATSMHAKPGDYLTIMTTTVSGSLNAMDVRVAGIFSSGVKEYDDRAIRMPIDGAQSLLQTRKVEKLLVFLKETDDTAAVQRDLGKLFTAHHWQLESKDWSELATFYHQVVLLYNGIFGFLGMVVFGIVIFSVANTMMMSIFERIREIGTLMAIGTTRWRVWRMFLVEGLIIGLVGGVLGLTIGAMLAQLINHGNVMLPPPPGYTVGYRLQILLQPAVLITSLMISIVTATLSSLLPALRASRLKIVDALGHI
ncbi:MAG TPA: FtsX-like permease family protein [Thermoanaerobaculia bacterium]|nr:FtsX-like permease family protein [Thermoanaerobaculia bacterium]